ncbi:MAG: mucoidy inhibitor MuiA family protein, partial [Planctomycetota bacterium]
LEVLRTEKEFLLSIKLGATTEIPKELTRQKPSVEDWKSLLVFLDDNLKKNLESTRAREIERRELDDKIQAKQREYNLAAQGDRPKERKIVTVSIDVSQPVDANLNISYVIYGAHWQPQYDARVLTGEKKVELIYYGIVGQNTGEDWTNITLSLSTAQPAVGARMPELPPAYAVIGIPPPVFIHSEGEKIVAKRGRKDKREMLKSEPKGGFYDEEEAAAEEPLVAQVSQANIQHQLTSAVYKVEKKETIPSDGAPHKTTIAQRFFEMAPEYVTTPKLAPYVYLKTDVVNKSELTLLGGDINVFLGMDFTGNAWTKTIAQNEKFELFLGTDENVKVERKLEEKKEEAPGFLGSKQTVYYSIKFKLQNFQKEKI